MREIRTLRSKWRGLETKIHSLLHRFHPLPLRSLDRIR